MQLITGVIDKPQKILVYGVEGIGKSSFAAQFPDPIFIDTEGSTTHLDVTRTPRPTSWAMLFEQVTYFIANPGLCKTLIIDTADWAEQLCSDYLCSKFQKKGIEEFGYGKGYVYLYEEFGKLLNFLTELIDKGIHVVITAHAKMRKFEQPDEMGSYDRWEMKLSKQVAPMLREWADMVLFANYETFVLKASNEMEKNKVQGGRRVMYTSHHPCWDAKNRHGLPDKTDFSYDVIVSHIKGGVKTAPVPAPIPEASPVPAPAPAPPPVPELAPSSLAPPVEPEAEATPPLHDSGKWTEIEGDDSDLPWVNESVEHPAWWDDLPKPLVDLMREHNVTPEEIQAAVAMKGHFPANTPFSNYPSDYINGVLIAAWPKVHQLVLEIREKRAS